MLLEYNFQKDKMTNMQIVNESQKAFVPRTKNEGAGTAQGIS